jgi:Fic family protein
LWIHPFLDGNGRVARLMSHAMLLEALGTGGIWSIARAWPAMWPPTRAALPPAISPAATISAGAAS